MNSVEAYVEALEAERTKMMMFQNELPLSIQLVSQTIDSCKGRFSFEDVDVPVLEFIPLEKNCTNSEEMIKPTDDDADDDAMGKKSDWLSSAQLWNKSPDSPPSISEEETPDALVESLVDKCESSDKEKSEERSSSPKKAESSSESQKSGAGCKKDDKAVSGTSKRKQRRCWSQDLHRRFLNSLKQLGGAHAATPKQIRELMKVDGLTNDEVKSHLQKYRLHTSNPNSLSSQRKPQEPPQFVVVGNIWAPPSEYADMAFTPTNWNSGTSITRVYTPMAAPPPSQPHPRQEPTNQKSQIKSKNPQGLNDALGRCISSSISSSTSTTASRVY